jgi:hypothetical protein
MITWVDWGIWLVYFAVIYTVLWFYRQSKKDDDTYKWFLNGFLVKVLGGVAFALVSIYYYGGDTLLYYRGSSILAETFFTDPSLFFELLFTPNNLPSEFSDIAHQISYSRTAEEWFMVRLLSFVNIISFNSYLVMTLLMSLISFWGGWKLFKVFSDILPHSKKASFLIVFLMPTVLFWGTGILKDTITLALISYIIYILYQVFEMKRKNFAYIIIMFLSSLIILKLKSYIILAFMPSLIYLFFLYFNDKIKSNVLKAILGPFLLFIFLIVGIFGIKNISDSTNYNAENIEQQIKGFHTWHTTTGGSSYNLGITNYSPIEITKKIPASLNVTFFRPYLWEARNLTSFIGALESTFVLFFFLLVLFKTKLRPLKYLKQNRFLYGILVFILIFSFAIGFTSYNFGALARYKMPIYPLFMFCLFYIIQSAKTIRT